VLQIRGENNFESMFVSINLRPCKPSEGKVCAEYSKESLEDYLTHPEFVLYQNTKRFDNKIFDGDSIVNESYVWTRHIDKKRANWMQL
jgi:hypothetical protein